MISEADLTPGVLLATKLYVPPPRPNLVARRDLLARLDAGLGGLLTLLAAPAGSGKTTLLGAWHAAHPERPFAWLSLDSGDNDPARFWRYVIAAIHRVQPDLGDDARALLQMQQPPPTEVLLGVLINAFSALQTPTVLVLDDYHVIETPAIHQALGYLLDHMPPALRLAITTRTDPPLQLARLRARGQLTELRLDDLRFSAAEASVFLEAAMGLRLPPESTALLVEHTEGWPAGLQLAALSLRGRGDTRGFVQSLGADRFISDYLVEEVVQRQPPAVQAFLLQTSILDRLCGPLCDAVVGTQDGQALLEAVERANLFLTPLDNERHWYRYHHLFADLLRRQLARQPALLPLLHRRAAAWYEAQGLTAEAIDHLLAVGDEAQAAALIESIIEPLMMRGELATLRRWVDAVPGPLLAAHPRLLLAHAWSLLLTGDLVGTERRLHEVAQLGPEEGSPLHSETLAIGSLVAALRGEQLYTTTVTLEALNRLPPGSYLHSLIALYQGVAAAFSRDIPTAAQALMQAGEIAEQTGNALVAILGFCQVAEFRLAQGQLVEAEAIYKRVLQLAVTPDGRPLPLAGMIYTGLGELYREWNQLEQAENYLLEGIALLQQWGEMVAVDGLVSLARLQRAQGRMLDAQATMEAADQLAQRIGSLVLSGMVAVGRTRLALADGDLVAAGRWTEQRGFGLDDAIDSFHELEYVSFARYLVAAGRYADAEYLLQRLFAASEAMGNTRAVVEMMILRAALQQAQGDTATALATLDHALQLSQPAGFVRLFADSGAPTLALLQLWQHSAYSRQATPALRAYVVQLIAASAPATPVAHEPVAQQRLVEPLRAQELAVLRLIAAGRSNQEIAAALVIALSTVKWHINNIYGKLGVKSRTQAIAQARALGLLASDR